MNHPIPDEALDADIAILAKKGKGKTYTAKGIVERLLTKGRRVLIFDPLSTWWGLKSNAAGTGPGFPVAVFGGPHADMPITEAAARPLARLLATENLPSVIDLGLLPKAAWQRIVREMLDELFTVNREALTIVLEEADVFAPQQPREGDSAFVLGEVDRIARRGRAFGFRLITITQRPARLHKDVLTQLSTLIALGTTSPQDRDAIKSWVEGNADRDQAKEVLDSLATLQTGEGWVWAPEFDILDRVKFPAITTLDTSATPKAGESRIEPKALAQVDLTEVRDAIAAEEEPAPAKMDVAERSKIWNAARAEGYADGVSEGRTQMDAIWRQRLAALLGDQEVPKITVAVPDPKEPANRHKARRGIPERLPSNGDLPTGARKMLETLDTNPPVKMTWNALAASVGNKARGGHFNGVRKVLRESGLIVEEGNLVMIAQPSATAAAPPSGPDRAAFLRGQWQRILGGRAAQIIGLLAESSGTKEEIAYALNCAPSGGHWNAAWKSLRDNDLVESAANGSFRLTAELQG